MNSALSAVRAVLVSRRAFWLFVWLFISGLAAAAESRAAESVEAKWIADFRRYAAQKDLENDGWSRAPKPGFLSWAELLRGLPAPDKWESLHRQLQAAVAAQPAGKERARLQAGSWFVAYLLGRRTEILAGLPAAPRGDAYEDYAAFAAGRLRESLLTSGPEAGLPENQVKQFEEQLLELEPGRRKPAGAYDMPPEYAPPLMLPDLVAAAGAERAEALLRRALRLPLKLDANRESGEATVKLARQLAEAGVADLKVPSWGLAQDVAAASLFAAMRARFGEPKRDDFEYRYALGYYLFALIQQGKVAEAVEAAAATGAKNAPALHRDVFDALEQSGRAEALWEFLRGWLARQPQGNEWDRFNRLSAQLDRQEEARQLFQTLLERGAFAGVDRLRMQRMQAEGELARDDLAAGVRRLSSLVAPPAASADELEVQLDLAANLMQLADLQGDAAAFSSAQASAEALMAASWRLRLSEALDLASSLTTTLNRLGRPAEAERISAAALARATAAKKKASDDGTGAGYSQASLVRERLCALVGLARWDEAERLIDESPWWPAGDVAGLLNETVVSTHRPVGWYFAEVFRYRGKNRLVRRLLEAQLVATPAADAVYESYLAVTGAEARPLLSLLAATDRYQERPLIWQAQLDFDMKQLDQAVAALEAAIAIDPSDGEQGRGDRMRVYAVLARVMAAKGDPTKAAFLEGVVKAIRLSETADRWFEVGAYARAIRLYREALGFFQDAYCVQSRLAVRLAGEGKMDEAAEHYRRAFELMPDSFGRVESHCFGCEHVFAGEKSQGVAEEVFSRMLAARPDKPQLHYLLGYLREEQERPAEAAKLYRKAVELDPLYLNAWKKLAGLQGDLKFSLQEREDLALKLTELDPARRHVMPSLEEVWDLSRLWRVLGAARKELAALPVADKLYVLKGSAAALGASEDYSYRVSASKLGTDFATVLGEHQFVVALQQYVSALNQ